MEAVQLLALPTMPGGNSGTTSSGGRGDNQPNRRILEVKMEASYQSIMFLSPRTEDGDGAVNVTPISDQLPELFYHCTGRCIIQEKFQLQRLFNITPLNSETTPNGYVRYSSGVLQLQ